MKTCPDCGERVYNLGCVNCNEPAYIEEQIRLDARYGEEDGKMDVISPGETRYDKHQDEPSHADLCARCGHPADWHRHDDVACLSTHPQPCSLPGTLDAQHGAPLAPFRCHGYDVDGQGFPAGTPESRCGCPDFVRGAA